MDLKNRNYGAVTRGGNRAPTLAIPEPPDIVRYTRRAIRFQLVGALALVSILLDPTQSYAQSPWTQVRGRLIGNGYYGPTPIAGVVLTLYNRQLGRSARALSRPDGTFYFGNIPLGGYFVEVWLPNSPYPRTFKVIVDRMPVANIGTFQFDTPVGVQSTQGAGAGPRYGEWLQSGL
jgi:hypothetical protein